MKKSEAKTPPIRPVKQILFVLGPHRSGTSAITRCLNLCGATLPEQLLRPNGANRTGYWEPLHLPLVHDLFLSESNLKWNHIGQLPGQIFSTNTARKAQQRIATFLKDEVADNAITVLKDPRISRLLPLWKTPLADAGIEPVFVIAIRSPTDVAASLSARNEIDPAAGSAIWLHHILEAERHSRGFRRFMMSYDRLLSDWRSELNKTVDGLGLGWDLNRPKLERDFDVFLSKEHRHHHEANNTLPEGQIANLAQRCFHAIDRGDLDDSTLSRELDLISDEFKSLSNNSSSPTSVQSISDESKNTLAGSDAAETISNGNLRKPVDHRSVLFITLDSCRFDTFQSAAIPNIRSVGGEIHKAHAPCHFTYGSHMAMFVGFTPGNAALAEPYINPKFAKIFRIRNGTRAPFGSAAFEVEGGTIIDGFNRVGYRTLGSGALAWFNPKSLPGRTLTEDFQEFYYPGNMWSVKQQVEWTQNQISTLNEQPVFAFINVGETHVPYWHEGAPWQSSDNPCVPFQEVDRSTDCAERQRACLEYVDGILAPLLEQFHDATIVITADHGDCWGEDGVWEHGVSHEATLSVPILFKVNPQIDAERRARDIEATLPIEQGQVKTAQNPEVFVRQSGSCVTAALGEEILGFNQNSAQYFSLNGKEALLWALISEPKPMQDLQNYYSEISNTEPVESKIELASILKNWKEIQMVEVGGSNEEFCGKVIASVEQLDGNSVPAWRSDIAIAKMDQEMVMFDRVTDCYHSAGATGSLIVELIDGKRSVQDIINILLDRYEIDRVTCERDVMQFLTMCAEANLFRNDVQSI